MLTQSYLRYLFSDNHSLHSYYVEKKSVSLNDIKRSLMLIERQNNVFIPDHYYRLGQENSFAKLNSLGELFTVGLTKLANEYLEIREKRIYVKAELQNDWQLMLPYMPPLILQAVKIWGMASVATTDAIKYIHDDIAPNITYTAIPRPYIPQMELLLHEQNGLNDLHLHLNGALETDMTWQDFLQYPDKVYKEMKDAMKNEKVKEQYLSLTQYAEPKSFRELIKIAFAVREQIYNVVYCGDYVWDKGKPASFSQMLDAISMQAKTYGERKHPLTRILGEKIPIMQLECYFYIKVLDYISDHKSDDTLIMLFHYYLLILGLTNRMLVQQPQCFGFEEFQKYTMNGFREYSEEAYLRRFYQMAGNELNNIRLLEGRFSPKDSLLKDQELLNKIYSGWEKLGKLQTACEKPVSELKLIAHFIKQPDKKRDEFIRFKVLRSSLGQKAKALAELHDSKSKESKKVLGIDAAASEFDTPPEVFAPSYRFLRERGYQHFTYHAGEDFFHILSGLRAMYEAVEYLNLQRGDRIGHGTASGVSPEVWRDNIGDRLLIRQGEYLDDLIFSFHLISSGDDEELKKLLPRIGMKIDDMSYSIYQTYLPVLAHIKAWQMRGEEPEAIAQKANPDDTERLFLKYHQKETDERYNKIIEVATYDIFDSENLVRMQQLLLKELHDREIVIETLPTSNVVIGNHHDFGTYHLLNWLSWKKAGKPIPPIVLGTDDVGIFATNIYNEYCNLYCQLLYKKQWNSNEIMDVIRELDYNAKIYRFGGMEEKED